MDRLVGRGGGADPRNFAARRQFAANTAFRPFVDRGWQRRGHLGWAGPLFWPYAYGGIFYSALWPSLYEDFDPFWAYGYDDIDASIFPRYGYEDYVRGPRTRDRMNTLTQHVVQTCSDEAAEVTGWPIEQIADVVQPDDRQRVALENLGEAVEQAAAVIQKACPTNVAFTPLARLDQMQQRLQALLQAADIVKASLARFYESLSDEQKARFDAMGAPASGQLATTGQANGNPQEQCRQPPTAWPTDEIERVVRPTAVQEPKLEVLQAAAAKAAETVQAACPGVMPRTPPARLDAIGHRLEAMLQGVQTVRPALADFYGSLNDEQRARFNELGRQLHASDGRPQ
jgi:LTXXQ motif family protein